MSGDQKLTNYYCHNKRCKTCSTNIEEKSAIFNCVACGECMHLTKEYWHVPRGYYCHQYYNAKCSLNMPKVPRAKKRTRYLM